jgi:hypothetical protein
VAYSDIPEEIRQYNQWINWRYETVNGKQTKIPIRPMDGRKASVTEPRDWGTFDQAVLSAQRCNGIGFVFTKSDPFAGIDIDCKETGQSIHAIADPILRKYQSYAEISPSGIGVHIIVKGILAGNGRRRNGIEIYDNARFFTFTGNVIYHAPATSRQAELVSHWQSIGGDDSERNTGNEISQGTDTQFYSDAECITHAEAATNGDKFRRLYSGNWQQDYPSQSEADFALINILCFYSRNIIQTIRLFRASGLGQRDKARRGDYVHRMARRAFDRMPRVITLNGQAGQPWFDAFYIEPWPNKPASAAALPPYVPPAAVEPVVSLSLIPSRLPQIPGLVGRLMAHCWHQSTYPIKEVALASALSTMSLFCSRTHRFGTRGLTLYLLLIAKTSVGKGFAYKAQNSIRNALIKRFSDPTGGPQYKARLEFIENMIKAKIASGSGLAQQLLKAPSTLAQLDEFVVTMKRMSAFGANTNDISIKEELLSLTDAASPGAVYREKMYSERNSNRKPITVQSACLTILATGTPKDFYGDLSNENLEGGFIPRFTLLDYDGTLPTKNENEINDIDRSLMDEITSYFNRMFETSNVLTGDINQYIDIKPDAEASAVLSKWERFCEQQVRLAHKGDLPTAGIWSRAQMHVAQIAGLISVGVNPHAPIMTAEHVNIALAIVSPGIEKITGKVVSGEIGGDDVRGAAEIRAFCRRVKSEGIDWFAAYAPRINRDVFSQGYIQASILKWYVSKRAPFRSHRLGSIKAFDDALASMVRDGEFERVEIKQPDNRKIPALIYLADQ